MQTQKELIHFKNNQMYAIVDIAGQQFKVQKDQKIFVHRLDAEVDAEMDFDKVFLVENEGKVTIGTPTVENAKIKAKVRYHVKGDKVIIFKKKRRNGYKLKKGHRQQYTQIQIGEIEA